MSVRAESEDVASEDGRPSFAPSCLLPASFPAGVHIPFISCPVPYDLPTFFTAMSRSILHPERNSTLILRAEIVSETSLLASPPPLPPGSQAIDGYLAYRQVHRRLLPRQPKRDSPLSQLCSFYRSYPDPDQASSSSSPPDQGQSGIVDYRCLVEDASQVPFYHPAVQAVRFTYTPSPLNPSIFPPTSSSSTPPFSPPSGGTLQIGFELFPSDEGTIFTPSSKLYRTALRLLETLFKHGSGILNGYVKRVEHDVVVKRDSFQDLYLELKDKFRDLDSRVQLEGKEGREDVKRHVWKDVAITCFLILLWRGMYPPAATPRVATVDSATSETRSTWGAPPGGFVDVGCGNGLLVHILTSEGYVGQGLELRPRKTWAGYPELTQSRLKKHAVDPTILLEQCSAHDGQGSPFDPSSFFIGNHADEMTPWIPVMAALTPESGFLNIPCCLHTLNARFTSATYTIPASATPLGRSQADVEKTLGVQAGGRYGAYLLWMAQLGWETGWEWEREALRIPSTRSWAIVGRRRLPLTPSQEADVRAHVLGMVETARSGACFKPRRAEGKAGERDEAEARQRKHEEERLGGGGGGGEDEHLSFGDLGELDIFDE